MIHNGDPHVIWVQAVNDPNPRMAAQQGVLLVNRSVQRTFSEWLLGMLLKSPVAAKSQVVSKLILKREMRIELLGELQGMKIYRTSMAAPQCSSSKKRRVNERSYEKANGERMGAI